ncbi:MAG: hypothetical protein AUI14_04445 [Actinobacteria bacterium 13_2_20CM_2_71_6]|nr:MAG: hypothetical protein AUI14_04445 [Actinobacteria bacterium 13_2_20CM_2_71_6]
MGPLLVRAAEDAAVVLPGTGPRVTLAVLLLRANQPVRVDALVEAVWNGRPPRSWASNVQTYVSRLRHSLPGIDIRYAQRAYRLTVDPGAFDLTEFWTDVDAGRKYVADGEPARAVARFRTALGHWRGEPLADLTIPALRTEVARLAEERLTIVEECLDAELAAGRHADVIGELRGLVARYPTRERLAAQLLLALARSGRTGDALAMYRDARPALGAEPGPELRRLHTAILRGEVTAPRPVAARTPFPICQLPPDLPNLLGRGALVADLLAQLRAGGNAVPLVVVNGPAGVGKTALAVHLAHRARTEYPDGQLYADLAGGTPHPRDPFDVLAEWLHALGANGSTLPDRLDARASAYRARLAERRVLVVLDDAADPAQVRPLLPGTPGSAVVVTGRTGLAGYAVTATRTLAPLRGPESRALLAAGFGPGEVAARRAAADRIAAACGHLPLALRIVATRADPDLDALADRLAGEQRRLDALDLPDTGVRAAAALRYATLDPLAQQAFRRLGWLGPLEFADWAAAALLDGADSAVPLGRLAEAGLVDPLGRDAAGQPRFRMHEVLCGYARELADEEADTALRRLAGYAIALTSIAAGGATARPALDAPDEPVAVPERIREGVARDGQAWLAAERTALTAIADCTCRHGRYLDGALLLDRLAGHLIDQHRIAELTRIAGTVRDSAESAGDRRTATWTDIVLGQARGRAGLPLLRRAATDGERYGYPDLLAWALLGLGSHAGPDAPLEPARRAAALFAERGDVAGQTRASRAMALALLTRGRAAEAEPVAAQGVQLARTLDEPVQLANLLNTHGMALLAVREPRRAQRVTEAALRLLRDIGAHSSISYLLGQLGRISATMGERSEALQRYAEARAIALAHEDNLQATLMLRDIAASWIGDGRADEAVPVLRRCVRTLVELGLHRRAGVTLRVLAAAYDALGDNASAAAAAAEAGTLDEYAAEQLRQALLLARPPDVAIPRQRRRTVASGATASR